MSEETHLLVFFFVWRTEKKREEKSGQQGLKSSHFFFLVFNAAQFRATRARHSPPRLAVGQHPPVASSSPPMEAAVFSSLLAGGVRFDKARNAAAAALFRGGGRGDGDQGEFGGEVLACVVAGWAAKLRGSGRGGTGRQLQQKNQPSLTKKKRFAPTPDQPSTSAPATPAPRTGDAQEVSFCRGQGSRRKRGSVCDFCFNHLPPPLTNPTGRQPRPQSARHPRQRRQRATPRGRLWRRAARRAARRARGARGVA